MITLPTTRTPDPSAARVKQNVALYLGKLAIFGRESLSFGQSVSYSTAEEDERLNNLGLDTRDMAILKTVADCRLITTHQLQRLFFTNHSTPISASRSCRRVLKRLAKQKVIARRQRRVGGVRGGSAAFVYSVGSVGSRLMSTPDKRLRAYITDPSDYFFDHTLAITEIFTKLHELEAAQKLHGLKIQTEPNCWRSFPASKETLRPDMYLQTVNQQGDEEFSLFIEVDRGTTHLPSLLKKLESYYRYYATGDEQRKSGLFPQVLWIVPDDSRQLVLQKAIASTHRFPNRLFVVKTGQNALAYICNVTNPPINTDE